MVFLVGIGQARESAISNPVLERRGGPIFPAEIGPAKRQYG